MSNSDWYAKTFGGGQRAARPADPPYQPVYQQPYQQQPQYGAPPPPAARPLTAEEAAINAWHGTQAGKIETPQAIRQYRGTPGAQQSFGACPQCGAPDGMPSFMPAADDVNAGGYVNPRMTDRSAARTPHCFYCGYRPVGRGAPMEALGIQGVLVEGAPRMARGVNPATRRGNQMTVDHSLVGRGA